MYYVIIIEKIISEIFNFLIIKKNDDILIAFNILKIIFIKNIKNKITIQNMKHLLKIKENNFIGL